MKFYPSRLHISNFFRCICGNNIVSKRTHSRFRFQKISQFLHGMNAIIKLLKESCLLFSQLFFHRASNLKFLEHVDRITLSFQFLIISIIRNLILTLFQTSIEYRNQFYDNHAHNFDSRSFLLSICLERSSALEIFNNWTHFTVFPFIDSWLHINGLLLRKLF